MQFSFCLLELANQNQQTPFTNVPILSHLPALLHTESSNLLLVLPYKNISDVMLLIAFHACPDTCSYRYHMVGVTTKAHGRKERIYFKFQVDKHPLLFLNPLLLQQVYLVCRLGKWRSKSMYLKQFYFLSHDS